MNEYLILQSIDKSVNRYRAYGISVSQVNDTYYMVKTTWGRISNVRQSNTRLFDTADSMKQYISQILQLRKNHGYALVEQSERFPKVKSLSKLGSAPCFSFQPTIF